MPKFSYTATGDDKKQHTGVLEAADENAARSSLLRLKLRPIVIKKVAKKKGNLDIPFLTKKRVGSKDIVVFTRQLSTMINAGVPLVRSLATMQKQTESEVFKKHLSQISKDVENGTAFANALEKHPDAFSPIYVNMVRAGEAGGILDDILKKLAIQQEKDAAIRTKFKSAMTYPMVLIGITVSVFILLMTVVVPKVGTIIADLTGGELPTMTKVMLGISDFILGFWFIHVAVVFGTVFYLRKFLRSVRIDIRRTSQIKVGEDVIGNRVRVKVVKNKIAPPFRQAEFDIMYNQGISTEGDILDLATDQNIVEKSGAWFRYGGENIAQGREAAKQYLKDNPKVLKEIDKKVRAAAE